ncbi:RHS repeat-associated core domain-containing protein (plasmid) [Streptomyces laculatispora]|uniref:RHS repeat-associated core domain-containing protein n=1 Tax=Streptomyces laculatispora TaxID=887464 RepID=A0ABY9IHT1_9ACTN|nr:RHS repeat-associated core domain-containing protein [Streptomyces laculatispora]WLQ45627.1 RHS repeat-associated core domain-containing protein [Streptomyces laculatispora]
MQPSTSGVAPKPKQSAKERAAAAAAPTVSNAVYAYDAVGRLVGVTDPVGETARYRYDQAGNRLGVDRFASSTLSVLSTVPVRAPAGAKVTLSGTGFSTTAANNKVTFGTKAATVASASATRLVVTVPAGAANGQISVTVGASTAKSPEPFTLASSGPVVSKMEPTSGAPGSQVVLSGSGFSLTPTDNVVRFNGGIVGEFVASTATSLTVKVPEGATSGHVQVESVGGVTTVPSDFVLTAGSEDGTFETTVRTSITDTSPPTVAVTTSGRRAQVLFDAERSDDIGFGLSASTFNSGVTLRLYDPQGGEVDVSSPVNKNGGDWQVHDLSMSGTFSLVVDPGPGNIGAATVTVSKASGGVLDLSAPAAETSMTRVGQEGHWKLSGTKGESLSIGIDASAMAKGSSTHVTLLLPDGRAVDSTYVSGGFGAQLDIEALPSSDLYDLWLDPANGATGTAKVTGSHYVDAGELAVIGPSTKLTIARPGQNAIAHFTAQLGQRISLGSTSQGFPSYTSMEVHGPDGKIVDSSFIVSAGQNADWDSPPLTASGTYTLKVVPEQLGTGTLTLTLSNAITTALTTTGPTSNVTIDRAGQNAQHTFQAAAGDDLSLGLTSNTFTLLSFVTVFTPSGAKVVNSQSLSPGYATTIPLPDLPETGLYRVEINPYQGATGTVKVTLSADAVSAPAIDGAAQTAGIDRPGQRMRVEFTASTAKVLGFALTDNTLASSSDAYLVGPSGGKGTYLGYIAAHSPAALYISGTTPGTKYTVVITPQDAATGAAKLWLSSPVAAGALSAAQPSATGEITRPGQQLQYTYDATVGDGAALLLSASNLSEATRLVHWAPGAVTEERLGYLTGASFDATLRAPLTAGTHTVLLQPDEPATGHATATLLPDANGGPLTVSGGRKSVAITAAGQNGRYTFAGIKGQKLTLGLDTPPGAWELSLWGPNGKWLYDATYMGATTVTKALSTLPEDGTYTLTINPDSMKTGTFNLGLTLPAAAPSKSTATPGPKSNDAVKTASTKHTKTSDTPAVVPTGADAWQPGAANLKGRDWVTGRGEGPKAPARLRAPPGKTALTGRVLKLDGKPLAKVTVRIGPKHARTDAQGRFLLTGINDDAKTLVVDGASANTKKRQYGRFDIRIHPKAGQSTDLGFSVWLTPLDTKHTVSFAAPAKKNITLTTPQIPGLEVRIPKGSVVRDENGKTVTELGITAIPIDRPPFPLPKNGVVPVYFTVQPGGTYVFPKGAQIVYPNYTHEAPATRVDFMDYDPEGKGWHVYGHGQVSADGRQVVPDAKTRVWSFHGAMFNISDLVPWDLTGLKDVIDWLSGDPVDLATGLLTDSHTDLGVTDPLGSAEVTRTYWQGDTHPRAFGIGRDLSYNAFLHSEKQYEQVDLYLPGGQKVHFTRTSPGTSFTDAVFEPLDTPTGFRGSKVLFHDAQWELHFRDGSVWIFPLYSPLKEIRDRHGNVLRLTRRDGTKGEITRITTPGGRWVSLHYDTLHRVDEARDNTGRTTSYTYDSAGRLSTVTDPAGKPSSYTYDGTSNRIKTAKDARNVTYMTNTFYADGKVQKQTLTEGAEYSFAYTQTGTGKVTSSQVTQPGGAVRRVEFDTDGYGVLDTAAYGSSLARKTQYVRGPNHRIDAVIDPYGQRTELTYDANGYVTKSVALAGTANARSSGTVLYDGPFDQPTRATDPLGNPTVFGYDSDGNLQTATDPENRKTTLTYAPDGQVKTVTDNANAVTEYTYRNGDLVSVKDAEGRVSSQFTDAAGRASATTDTAGSLTTIAYDKLNQPRTVTDPLGQSTGLDYDDNGNLITLTDARNNASRWEYDNADRPKSATDALGAQATFEYDAAGFLKKATSRSKKIATATYDLLGRPKTAQYGVDLAGQAESTVGYDYDAHDLPKQITDSQAGNQIFTYDTYDRPKTVTGPNGAVSYDYDAADRRKTMTAAGQTTSYGFDKASILTSVTTGTQQVGFDLDAVGREKTATLPGGITRTTGYDKTGTIKSIAYAKGTTSIGDLNYTRDDRTLQTGLTGTLANVALPAAETGTVFGNDNRITTYSGRSFTYDADGQLKSDGLRNYTWNARGQLSGLTKAGQTSTFGYDALGTRSTKTVGGATNKFLTDAGNPLVEQNSAGATAATVATSGLDEYLTRTENGTTQVYLTDALGSVIGLANSDGTIATKYAYDPNGTATTTGTASTNPYTFTGRENDTTGLLYYRDRYYDPQTGRFISQDPIGQAGGTNLYQYALSSPTTYTDPTGDNPMIAACAVGGALDGGLNWAFQRLSGRKVNWGQVGQAAWTGCALGMAGEALGTFLAVRNSLRGGSCLAHNSFTADTPVLMADGTSKPIKDIKVGDKVQAADPETGEAGTRTVTALIEGNGDKQLVDLTIDTGRTKGAKTGTLTATDGHPFWVPALHQWVEVGDLKAGQWLQTSAGTWVQVAAVKHRTDSTEVYNLTVDDLHTYYVLAGSTPVLVHNSSGNASIDDFRGGYYFHTVLNTAQGNIDVGAFVEIDGNKLVLDNVSIYGANGDLPRGSVGPSDFLALKRKVIDAAAAQGFGRLEVNWIRTSSGPENGKSGKWNIDLPKGC